MARPAGACVKRYCRVAALANMFDIAGGPRLVLAPDTGSETVLTNQAGH
jgi:hypothetical protein